MNYLATDLPFDCLTASGQPIVFDKPWWTEINPNDLYLGLNTYRYMGAINWTVLQHLYFCLSVADDLWGAEVAAYCAVHDIHEAYVGDMVSGLKRYCNRFNSIESKWELHVIQSLGLDLNKYLSTFKDKIKLMDVTALYNETTYYSHPLSECFENTPVYYPEKMALIESMPPQQMWDTIVDYIVFEAATLGNHSQLMVPHTIEAIHG